MNGPTPNVHLKIVSAHGKEVYCPAGLEAVSGGGTCSNGDILSGSFPIYNHNIEGWKIDCESPYSSYGSKKENCNVYAVCLVLGQKQSKGGY